MSNAPAIPAIHNQLLVPRTDDHPRSGEGDTVQLRDGSILFAYGHFRGGRDHDDADIVVRRSRDGGVSWSEPEILQRKRGELNVMSVSLLRLHSGKLLFLFLEKNTLEDCRPFCRFSDDDGNAWGPVHTLTDVPGYYVVNNDRIIQTSSGRLLVPGAFRESQQRSRSPMCGVLYSDDEGQSWQRGAEWIRIKKENAAPPPLQTDACRAKWQALLQSEDGVLCQEPGVVELEDGRIMMWARTNGGHMYRTVSSDGGDTWADFIPARDIVAPCGPQSIKRIPGTDRLLCVYNDHSDPAFVFGNDNPANGLVFDWRTPLSAAVSDDGGGTWRRLGDLEPDRSHNYCYTSILLFDGKALFTYYQSIELEKDGLEVRRNLSSLKISIVDQQSFMKG